MHRFLTAFLVLSTLAMTQNVVAGTPSPLASTRAAAAGDLGLTGAVFGPAAGLDVGPAPVGRDVPEPATMLLLVTGLAGLSAVGSREPAPRRAGVRA